MNYFSEGGERLYPHLITCLYHRSNMLVQPISTKLPFAQPRGHRRNNACNRQPRTCRQTAESSPTRCWGRTRPGDLLLWSTCPWPRGLHEHWSKSNSKLGSQEWSQFNKIRVEVHVRVCCHLVTGISSRVNYDGRGDSGEYCARQGDRPDFGSWRMRYDCRSVLRKTSIRFWMGWVDPNGEWWEPWCWQWRDFGKTIRSVLMLDSSIQLDTKAQWIQSKKKAVLSWES